MIAEKNFSSPDSASFENVFQIRCNLRDTTSFAILLLNTTPFPLHKTLPRRWVPKSHTDFFTTLFAFAQNTSYWMSSEFQHRLCTTLFTFAQNTSYWMGSEFQHRLLHYTFSTSLIQLYVPGIIRLNGKLCWTVILALFPRVLKRFSEIAGT